MTHFSLQKARYFYERNFNKKLRHHLVLRLKDLVYIEIISSLTKTKINAVAQEATKELILKNDGHLSVLRAKIRTVKKEVDGTHNVVSRDRITVAKTAEEAMQATDV